MASLIMLAPLALLVAFGFFAWKRSLTYMHVFQQEEYDGPRFIAWLARERAIDRKASLALLVIGVLTLAPWEGARVAGFVLSAGALAAIAFAEADPRQVAKKKLALTARVKRILAAAGLFLAVPVILLWISGTPSLAWIAVVQAIPFALVLGNLALSPYEAHVQQGFWDEAHEKLLALQPTTVGITGSFGKTSVKHILGHLLETMAPSLVTPGSVNTPMGISRIVRERLGAHHRFFVCEMGAYGPGSIIRLCRLAPPDLAVVTAVGHAHYERFRSLDTVAETKFELPEAAVERGGKTILASSVMAFAAARAFRAAHPDKVLLVGPEEDAALRILTTRETARGVEADIVWQGKTYTLAAPLHGLHHAANMALAFATACTLGALPEDVVTALKSVPQIAHRLEVKPQPDGSTIVDDAYNSNPVGFAAALAALDGLVKPGGRRILVTPGMVELGAAHDSEHARLGALAAHHVDVLLPVIQERITSFVSAFRAAAPGRPVVPCANFAGAQAWLQANVTSGDVVLFENDLPDLYERRLRL